MKILGLDIGSSSVKAGMVRNGKIVGPLSRAAFDTQFVGVRAEVKENDLLRAIAAALADLDKTAGGADAIALAVMSPAWVAMDAGGKALTPIITHQDRRSVQIAWEIERRIGRRRHLQIAGNRPFPGGISSTTAAWYAANEPRIIRRADLLGHLNTLLHRRMTGARVIDPSNASFTGLYQTVRLGDWSGELCAAAGVDQSKLPQIVESNVVAGKVTAAAARQFNLMAGTPVMAGLIDTSAAMLLAGARSGQLLNVTGSTDVLALCTHRPRPDENLLTRALGIGRRWMSVATLAAAGSSLAWVKEQFFSDLDEEGFYNMVRSLVGRKRSGGARVIFEPYLAGSRISMEQKTAALRGLTLATSRQDILLAVIDALAAAGGARLKLLAAAGKIGRSVVVSGHVAGSLGAVLYRDWPGKWRFRNESEATLRGLSLLEPREA